MPILLDTHAWIWWVTEDRRVPAATRRRIEHAERREDVLLSLISIWEVAKRVEEAQLVFDRPIESWLETATSKAGLQAPSWVSRSASPCISGNDTSSAISGRRPRSAAADV